MNSTYPVKPTLETISLSLFDADAMTEVVRSSHIETFQLGRGDFRADLKRIDINRLTVDAGCYTRKVMARGEFPRRHLVLGCVLDSGEIGGLNGYHFGRNDVAIFPDGSEFDYLMPTSTSWCTVQLSEILLEEAGCAEMVFDRVKLLPGNRPETARLIRILDMLTKGQAPAPGSGLPCSPDEEIVLEQIRRMLNEHLGRRAQGRRPSLHERMTLVQRFEQLVRDRINTAVRISELCTELGVSERKLEYLFKEEIGMTPKQFTNVLRLNEVRRELLRASAENETITSIAMRFGIRHLGRFSAAYLRQFGELPSHTLSR